MEFIVNNPEIDRKLDEVFQKLNNEGDNGYSDVDYKLAKLIELLAKEVAILKSTRF